MKAREVPLKVPVQCRHRITRTTAGVHILTGVGGCLGHLSAPTGGGTQPHMDFRAPGAAGAFPWLMGLPALKFIHRAIYIILPRVTSA